MYICIYICIYVYMYICIYVHIYIYTQARQRFKLFGMKTERLPCHGYVPLSRVETRILTCP